MIRCAGVRRSSRLSSAIVTQLVTHPNMRVRVRVYFWSPLPRPPLATYLGFMDVRTHEDVAAAAAAHSELGHQYNDALAEGLIERISSEIDKQVDARLAQRGIQPSRAAWANVAMGLGSVGLGIGATAVTLHSLSVTVNTAAAGKPIHLCS